MTTSQADRQIKFRAWVHDTMYEDVFFTKVNNRLYDLYQIINGVLSHVCLCDKDTLHLMQFTGLLDKNGKEIYEGDLLRIKFKTQYYDLEAIYEVVHRGFTTQFVIRSVVSPSEVYTDIHLEAGKDFEWYAGRRLEITSRQINGRQSSEDIEVCGDIHANSNLLQG